MSRVKCKKLQIQYISRERLIRYKNYKEYLMNIKFSRDFYIPLSVVEVSFRNSLNQFYTEKIGENWLEQNSILQPNAQKSISNSKNILKQQKKIISQDNLIAELSFGFWVKLLTKVYSRYLRYNDLKQIFPNLPSKKDKSINRHFIFTKLNNIRLFRNKVFHHDKIISKVEYQNMMDEIYEVLGYFDDKIVKITKELNDE